MSRRGFCCFALVVVGLGLGVASCDQLSPTLSVTASKDTGKGEIRVGIYGSLTGSESTFGISTEQGVVLAVEERNAACKDDWETNPDPACGVKGRKIDYYSLDDAGKSQEAGTAVTLLITKDHVHAVIGEVASSLSRAGGAVAQAYRVPMISPSSTNESVTLIGNMISRVCFIDGFQGYVVAKFARDTLKAQRVGILYDQQQAYSKGLALEFEKAFLALGGMITTKQTYTGGDADFSAQLNTIRSTSPEAVFVPGYYNDAGNIAVQAKKLGLNVPLLGGDGWDSEKLTEIGGAAMEGNYYANHYSAEETRPAIKNFVSKYQQRWGKVPDGLAALGYDAALVLFAAMDRSPTLDGPDLAAAIAATKDFPAVTGNITLDKNRNPVKSAVMLVVRDGKPHYAATVEPPTAPLPDVPVVADTGGGHTSFMTKFLQTLVDTLAVGALYALLALGYTLVYGVLLFINFAHSDVFTFGAWISFTFATKFGWTESAPWFALPVILVLAMVTCSALGVTIERLAYRPLRRAPRLNVLITAIGVSLLLQNVGQLPQAFGPNPQHMPPLVADQSLATLAGVHIRLVDVIVFVLAVALVGVLQWLVYGTKMGRAMRAVSYNERVAALMGINVNRVVVFTFAVGSALAAAGGLLFALKYGGLQITSHSTWVLLGLTAFVAAVVGGIGDVRGAAVGALLIAGVQQFGAAYVSTQLRDVYVFSILILVLLVKPSGLFGTTVVEKV